MSVLRRRYPPGTMSELQAACQASLSNMKAAFPDDTILASTSLQRFLQVALCGLASAARNHWLTRTKQTAGRGDTVWVHGW